MKRIALGVALFCLLATASAFANSGTGHLNATGHHACNNGRDDDFDGLIDYPDDPGCTSRRDNSEEDPLPPPPTDSDGDGVPDSSDQCPGTPAGTTVDQNGCPITGGGGGGSEPGPIAGQGYHEVFLDNFDGTVLNPLNWWPHIWWTDPVSGSVSVHDGMVSLYNRRSDGFPDSVDIQTGTEWFEGPGGVPLHSYQYGYFEARMRYTDAKGAWPAFWLSSVAHMTANWPNCPEPDLNYELDIFEGQGDEPFGYHGTQHSNTGDVCGIPDQQDSSPYDQVMPSRVAGNWHKFAAKWTATSVTYYFDDQVVDTQSVPNSADQQMYLILSMYSCGWDSSNSCDNSTPDTLETDADYVKVWQR